MKFKTLLLALVAFIAVQPIIDVLTLGSMTIFSSSITFGVIIRALYMAVLSLLLLLFIKKRPEYKWYVIYLIGLGVLLIINSAVNSQLKDPYFLFHELKFFNKVIYFHIVLFGLLMIYKELRKQSINVEKKTTTYFWFSGLTIGLIFVIAHLTGTSINSYAWNKIGYSAWFYAGNEIGAIMAIIMPIVTLWAIERTNTYKQAYYWIPVVIMSFSMIMLGTKVGYGGILIVLLTVIIGSGILMLMKQTSKKVKTNLGLATILLVLLGVLTPITPVFTNTFTHLSILGIELPSTQTPPEDTEEVQDPADESEVVLTNEQVQNLVFSSREKYLVEMKQEFDASTPIQKVFGMGFAGNYENEGALAMIEMDFHDWFFSFGMLGFIYFIAPLVYYTSRFIWFFIRHIKTEFSYFTMLYGVSFLLALGIAATAGHTLTAPAVSIYPAAILAMVTIYASRRKEEMKIN